MDCCDEYGQCTLGHDCPMRVERITTLSDNGSDDHMNIIVVASALIVVVLYFLVFSVLFVSAYAFLLNI